MRPVYVVDLRVRKTWTDRWRGGKAQTMYIENISRLSTEIGCKQQASESWQVALPLEVLIYGRALEHVVFTLQQCLGQLEVEKRELT